MSLAALYIFETTSREGSISIPSLSSAVRATDLKFLFMRLNQPSGPVRTLTLVCNVLNEDIAASKEQKQNFALNKIKLNVLSLES